MSTMSHNRVETAKVTTQDPVDIEHLPVDNDPRLWSAMKKNLILALVASASMVAGFAAMIENPTIADIESDLDATPSEISLTISLFIFFHGTAPILWSAVSEIYGRKMVYVVSLTIFFATSLVVATSKTIEVLITFRTLQAAGSSSVMAIGAATLADVFDPKERGTKMGIYYAAPLLGPAIAPLIGGGLATLFNWRAPFYFLVILSGLIVLCYAIFFHDTFRKERSLTYQKVLSSRRKDREGKKCKPGADSGIQTAIACDAEEEFIKPTLADINLVKPMWQVLRRRNNYLTLIGSAIISAFMFIIVYTGSRTLSSDYHYNPFQIGSVLLCFGIGGIAGSVSGGRWSDRQLAQMKTANSGKTYPEMRLRSLWFGAILAPLASCSYGWVSELQVHISAQCVLLFLSGFSVIWMYSSPLAYIVDANIGRSGIASACNSMFRGAGAFVAIETAVPLQDSLGDGWLYTIWAGLLVISSTMFLLVQVYGREWRETFEQMDNDTATP